MLENVKKALFRVLCLGALCLAGGLMAEPNAKKLVDLGRNSYSKQDFTQAKKYFEKACELNDGDGCSALGLMQYDGIGIAKDEKQAIENFKKSCKLGDEKIAIFSTITI
ncbi:SEL1-like repeat protein [Helicobacter pylori]|nr:SEL1-like repeat protein [Helicobacter pylori]MCQ2863087.1 SEL1-like repeat protein [Helicobacter pylori]MCQ2882474.1 SEL1-like repeat protein [Helicobacter pylori]